MMSNMEDKDIGDIEDKFGIVNFDNPIYSDVEFQESTGLIALPPGQVALYTIHIKTGIHLMDSWLNTTESNPHSWKVEDFRSFHLGHGRFFAMWCRATPIPDNRFDWIQRWRDNAEMAATGRQAGSFLSIVQDPNDWDRNVAYYLKLGEIQQQGFVALSLGL